VKLKDPVVRCVCLVLCFMAPVRSSIGEVALNATVPLNPEVAQAIVRAQDWLAGTQKGNGAWSACNGQNAMASMAMMVNGTTPGKGKYGAHVARAIDYLISTQQPSGLLAERNGSMYQHALATLALAEAYGMTRNPRIRESLIMAVDLIVHTQHYGGGWRYKPVMTPGDLSVTVMQVMALRAVAEIGILVPDETISHAVTFIERCWSEKEHGFGYAGPKPINFNRTAAGVVCLQSVGLHDNPRVPRAIATINKLAFNRISNSNFWYGHYYASIALYHYGGESWKDYYPRICTKVLKDWEQTGHYPKVLDTAWAILVIGAPYRYLPIYQR